MVRRIGRRQVLGWLAGLGLAGGGLAILDRRRPTVTLVQSGCEGGATMPKVLVAYARRGLHRRGGRAGGAAPLRDRALGRGEAGGSRAGPRRPWRGVAPTEEAFFPGRVEPARQSLLGRLAVRVVGSPVGDFRDWTRIEAWADSTPPKLFPA